MEWRRFVTYLLNDPRMNVVLLSSVQKIELQRQSSGSTETVRGHIVISLISRDRGSASPRHLELSDFTTAVSAEDSNELPEGSVSVDIVLLSVLLHNTGQIHNIYPLFPIVFAYDCFSTVCALIIYISFLDHHVLHMLCVNDHTPYTIHYIIYLPVEARQ